MNTDLSGKTSLMTRSTAAIGYRHGLASAATIGILIS